MVKKKIVIPVVLRLLIPLLIGVVFSYYTKMYGSFIAILSIMFLLIALEMLPLRFIKKTKRVIGAIVMIFFFVFGTFITSLNDLSVHPQYFLKDEIVYQDDVQLRLLEEPVGAMHVLAVSGLHVGIVMLILGFFLKPVKRLPRGKSIFLILVLVGIWLYVLLTGMSSSVMRAAIMFSFIQIGREIERENGIYQSIFISAFIMILMQPLVIFQVGFQLSYIVVLVFLLTYYQGSVALIKKSLFEA